MLERLLVPADVGAGEDSVFANLQGCQVYASTPRGSGVYTENLVL